MLPTQPHANPTAAPQPATAQSGQQPNPPPAHDPRKPAGRPTAFSDQKREHFLSLIRMGSRRGAAARMIGLSRFTVRRAMRRDSDFADRVQRAEAEAALRFMHQVNEASKTQWRAAAWILDQADRPSPRAVTVRKLVRSNEFEAAVARAVARLSAEKQDVA